MSDEENATQKFKPQIIQSLDDDEEEQQTTQKIGVQKQMIVEDEEEGGTTQKIPIQPAIQQDNDDEDGTTGKIPKQVIMMNDDEEEKKNDAPKVQPKRPVIQDDDEDDGPAGLGLTQILETKQGNSIQQIQSIQNLTELNKILSKDEKEGIPALIFYQGKRIINTELLRAYRDRPEFGGNLGIIIKRMTAKQNIIFTSNKKVSGLAKVEDLKQFLKQFAKVYNTIIDAIFLAKGGESIVYRIEHAGLDEIVAKCPYYNPLIKKEEIYNKINDMSKQNENALQLPKDLNDAFIKLLRELKSIKMEDAPKDASKDQKKQTLPRRQKEYEEKKSAKLLQIKQLFKEKPSFSKMSKICKKEAIISMYEGIFMESQTLKLNAKRELVAEIKEEIIEFNKEECVITRYCAIVECAANTLDGLCEIWVDEEKNNARDLKREYYTPEKLSYYYFQAICAVEYLHQKNVFYSDMKPPNLLIFRNQEVKLGDFGVSIKLADDQSLKPGQDQKSIRYQVRGTTPGFVPPETVFQIKQGDSRLTKQKLFEWDRYALGITFQKCNQIVEKIVPEENQKNEKFYKMWKEVAEEKPTLTLYEIMNKWSRDLTADEKFLNNFAKQMLYENKEIALQSIFQISIHRKLIQHNLDIMRYQLNENLQLSRFAQIEEDKKKDIIEQLDISNPDYKEINESLQFYQDEKFQEIMIQFFKGWQWGEKVEDEIRTKLRDQVIPCFYIGNEKQQKITDKDFIEVIIGYKSNWYRQVDKYNEQFEIIRQHKNQAIMLLRFLDAFIGEPKEQDKDRYCYDIQKLYLAAQLFEFEDLSHYFLFRYGRVYRGLSKGRIGIHKALEYYRKQKNDRMTAECLMLLTAQCELGDETYARKYYQEAKVIIKKLYGRQSKNYAELCEARTKYLANLGKYKIAWSSELKAQKIYEKLLGSAHPKTLEAHKKVSEFIYDHYQQNNFKNFKEKDALTFLTSGLKHAKGQKDLQLKAVLYQLAMGYYGLNIKPSDKDITSLWFIQALIRTHRLEYFMKGFNQPHLMGPFNHIFNDRILVNRYLQEDAIREKDFDKYIRDYLENTYIGNIRLRSDNFESQNTQNASDFARVHEFDKVFCNSLNNTEQMVYVSEPFGNTSERFVEIFDDFEFLMPFLMNPKDEKIIYNASKAANYFDKSRAYGIHEILYIEQNKTILGLRNIYRLKQTAFERFSKEAPEEKQAADDSDYEEEKEDEEITISYQEKPQVLDPVATKFRTRETGFDADDKEGPDGYKRFKSQYDLDNENKYYMEISEYLQESYKQDHIADQSPEMMIEFLEQQKLYLEKCFECYVHNQEEEEEIKLSDEIVQNEDLTNEQLQKKAQEQQLKTEEIKWRIIDLYSKIENLKDQMKNQGQIIEEQKESKNNGDLKKIINELKQNIISLDKKIVDQKNKIKDQNKQIQQKNKNSAEQNELIKLQEERVSLDQQYKQNINKNRIDVINETIKYLKQIKELNQQISEVSDNKENLVIQKTRMEQNRQNLLKKDYNNMIESINNEREKIEKRQSELQYKKITFRPNEHIVRIDIQRNQHIGIMLRTKIFDLEKDDKKKVVLNLENRTDSETVHTYYIGDYHQGFDEDHCISQHDCRVIAFAGAFIQHEDHSEEKYKIEIEKANQLKQELKEKKKKDKLKKEKQEKMIEEQLKMEQEQRKLKEEGQGDDKKDDKKEDQKAKEEDAVDPRMIPCENRCTNIDDIDIQNSMGNEQAEEEAKQKKKLEKMKLKRERALRNENRQTNITDEQEKEIEQKNLAKKKKQEEYEKLLKEKEEERKTSKEVKRIELSYLAYYWVGIAQD